MNYLMALGLTITIELTVIFCFRAVVKIGQLGEIEAKILFAFIVGINLISHPVAWLAYQKFTILFGNFPAFLIVEVLVLIFEAEMMKFVLIKSRKEAYLISSLINCASAAYGIVFS